MLLSPCIPSQLFHVDEKNKLSVFVIQHKCCSHFSPNVRVNIQNTAVLPPINASEIIFTRRVELLEQDPGQLDLQ